MLLDVTCPFDGLMLMFEVETKGMREVESLVPRFLSGEHT